MRQIITVFGFTFRDAVRKKSFIISSVIMAILVVGICLLPRLLGAFSGGDDSPAPESGGAVTDSANEAADTRGVLFYLDPDGLIPGGAEALSAAFPGLRVESGDPAREDDYRADIAENGDNSLVLARAEGETPRLTVVTKDFMAGFSAASAADALSAQYAANGLAAFGLGEEALALARTRLAYSAESAGTMNVSGYAMGIILTMIIFFAVYFYGYGVSMSVANEKTSRVMETLVVSAKPSRILLGKCLAMGAVGLLQLGSMILLFLLCFRLLIPQGQMLFGMALSFSAFTPVSALLILAYFLLGYALYAMMNAVCGATVSKIEDLNTAMMPVMFVALGGFYLGYFATIMGAQGAIGKLAMYLPFSAPFSMPFLLLNGGCAATDIAISLALLAVATVLVSLLSIRLYSASVLHYGRRLRLREMLSKKEQGR